MVMAAVRAVAVIISNVFTCIFCYGIHCIGSCSGVNRVCCGCPIAHHVHTYHYHYHPHHHHHHNHKHHLHNQFTTSFTTQHTLNYSTSDDGGISDNNLVVIVVVVMVRYFGCWWYSDVDGCDYSCCSGGICN